jgi:hypothetical protein
MFDVAFLRSNLTRYWAKLFSRSLVAYPAGHRFNPFTARAESQPAPEQAHMGIFQAGSSKQPRIAAYGLCHGEIA